MDEQVIEDIYTHLADGESKRVFEKRLMYSLTDDHRFIQELVDGLPEAKWLRAKIESCEENFIFGAGNRGRDVYRLAPHRWAGILDNDEKKWGIKSGGGDNRPAKGALCTSSRAGFPFRPAAWHIVSAGDCRTASWHGHRATADRAR